MTSDHSALIERLEGAANGVVSMKTDRGDYGLLNEAAAALREMQRFMPPISFDGPNVPNEHRLWLARQLLDSKLSDDEAFGIARSFPSAPNQAKEAGE